MGKNDLPGGIAGGAEVKVRTSDLYRSIGPEKNRPCKSKNLFFLKVRRPARNGRERTAHGQKQKKQFHLRHGGRNCVMGGTFLTTSPRMTGEDKKEEKDHTQEKYVWVIKFSPKGSGERGCCEPSAGLTGVRNTKGEGAGRERA